MQVSTKNIEFNTHILTKIRLFQQHHKWSQQEVVLEVLSKREGEL